MCTQATHIQRPNRVTIVGWTCKYLKLRIPINCCYLVICSKNRHLKFNKTTHNHVHLKRQIKWIPFPFYSQIQNCPFIYLILNCHLSIKMILLTKLVFIFVKYRRFTLFSTSIRFWLVKINWIAFSNISIFALACTF